MDSIVGYSSSVAAAGNDCGDIPSPCSDSGWVLLSTLLCIQLGLLN